MESLDGVLCRRSPSRTSQRSMGRVVSEISGWRSGGSGGGVDHRQWRDDGGDAGSLAGLSGSIWGCCDRSVNRTAGIRQGVGHR